jgi:hypothetical protein
MHLLMRDVTFMVTATPIYGAEQMYEARDMPADCLLCKTYTRIEYVASNPACA